MGKAQQLIFKGGLLKSNIYSLFFFFCFWDQCSIKRFGMDEVAVFCKVIILDLWASLNILDYPSYLEIFSFPEFLVLFFKKKIDDTLMIKI